MFMYHSPRLYEFVLRRMHGPSLEKRYELIRQRTKGKRVLDVGCGTGMLGEYVDNYAGIDLNSGFLQYARKKGLDVLKLNVFDVKHYPKADVYVVTDLLHHVQPNHHDLVADLVKTKKGLIICEPFDSSESRFKRILYSFLDFDLINPMFKEKWYTKQQLTDFYKDVVKADEIIEMGGDLIAFKGI